MKQMIRMLACIIAVASGVVFGAERLPDEGLKRAQEAEKLIKQDRVEDALKLLQKLDDDYPGHSAVNLRLAQVYDGKQEYGPALYYYRRYVAIKQGEAHEEARSRAMTLEMMAGTRAAAEEFAKKMGKPTEPVSVPTPDVKQSIERPAVDGSLVPVTGPEDLAKPQVTPLPNRSGQDERSARRRAVLTPLSGQEVVAIAPADEQVKSTPVPTIAVQSLQPAVASASVEGITPAAPAAISGTPAYGSAAASPQAYFRVSRGSGVDATVKISNSVKNSVLTFAAVADNRKPINAVLMAGESREINVPAGKYDVTINVTENGYVPTTIVDKSFELEFEPGRIYSKRVTGTND